MKTLDQLRAEYDFALGTFRAEIELITCGTPVDRIQRAWLDVLTAQTAWLDAWTAEHKTSCNT